MTCIGPGDRCWLLCVSGRGCPGCIGRARNTLWLGPRTPQHRILLSVRRDEDMTTDRLSLRRPTRADVDAIFSINSDQRACVHNPSDRLATRDEALRLFQRWDEHWLRFGFGYWVVRRRGLDATIG